MPRVRRYIQSGVMYELCFRAKSSLPFVAYESIKFILQCVLARTQRDGKVTLCHEIWNGSHPHIIVVSKDAQMLVNFCAEVQKKFTDICKRLLGLDYLNIWEGTPSVIKIGDLDAAKERISYLYANPAQDNLEDRIELFPGLSTWDGFLECQAGLDKTIEGDFPWIRLPSVPKISHRTLSRQDDRELLATLKERNRRMHRLTREPNAWMRCFGISDDSDVAQINQDIVRQVRDREENARQKRRAANKQVLGRENLCAQPLLKEHTPKKRERKILIITRLNELRMEFLAQVKSFCAKCRECLNRYRSGEIKIDWPPEAFVPPLPPRMNLLPT